MEIIPTVNCLDFNCVAEKIKKAAEFLPAGGWIQIDIADGKFTEYETWDNPSELLSLTSYLLNLSIEVHLMVENPEQAISEWIKVGAKRIIIHEEAVQVSGSKFQDLKQGAEIGLAVNPETPAEKLEPYLEKGIKFVQILAVPPGKSGQKFDGRVLEKIKFLKQNYPDVIIEVDGGINLETAKLCKDAGVDILAAGSYIWESADQKTAFQNLLRI